MQVTFDIETASLVDLRTAGARKYVRHPSSRLLSLVAKCEGSIYVWLPRQNPEIPDWLSRWIAEDRLFVSHNGDLFDAPFLHHHYGLTFRNYDTMPAARASGLPGGLDAIGQALGFGGKDKEGKRAMLMLCKAKVRNGEVQYPVGTPHLWDVLVRYNIQDVEITERVYNEGHGREESEVVRVTNTINSRGIYIDRDWLKTLLGLWNEIEHLGGDRLADLSGGVLTRETAASVPKIRQWLLMQGLRIKSISRKELDQLFEDPDGYFGASANAEVTGDVDIPLIVEVLRLRQQLTRAMKGKLERIDNSLDSDSRVRDTQVYWGAHTGRFSGRGLQPQNLSKGVKIDVEAILRGPRTIDAIGEAAQRGGFTADDVLVSLVRPVFAAPPGSTLGIVDYSTVEPRAVAWLAGEEWMLQCFADPRRDIYCEWWEKAFGERIERSDPKRQIAKVCVIGLGYGMSHRKLTLFARSSGMNLEALGLSATDLVQRYRTSCPATVAMWKEVGRGLAGGRRDGFATVCHGRVEFRSVGDHLLCRLPSGRTLTYRNCRFERGIPGYCKILGIPPFETELLRYRSIRGFDVDLFGTKAVENIGQAVGRDLLVDAMVKLEGEGWPIVLTVHDEVVCELTTPLQLDRQAVIMSTPPAWAPDFPLRVDGYTCERYVKSAWSDSYKVEYMGGKKL